MVEIYQLVTIAVTNSKPDKLISNMKMKKYIKNINMNFINNILNNKK